MVRLASGRGGGGLSEHRDSVQWQSHGRYPGVEYAQFREPQRTVKTNPIAIEFFLHEVVDSVCPWTLQEGWTNCESRSAGFCSIPPVTFRSPKRISNMDTHFDKIRWLKLSGSQSVIMPCL